MKVMERLPTGMLVEEERLKQALETKRGVAFQLLARCLELSRCKLVAVVGHRRMSILEQERLGEFLSRVIYRLFAEKN